MTDLGIHLEIQKLCGNIGAHPLLQLNEPTYAALTSEFLASYKYQIHRGDRSSASLQFQLGNEARSLSLTQLNNIFGFPAVQEDESVTSEELSKFWYDISGFETPFVGAQACYVVHPVFRVIHRLLGNTIGARKEPSKIKEVEHRVLFCMVHERRIDLGHQLALKFGNDYKTATAICTGGLITILAKHFGIDLELYSATPSRLIDMNHLRSIGMVKKDRQEVSLRIFQTNTCMSFAPFRISTETKDCWYRRWVKQQLRCSEEEDDEEGEEGEDGEGEEGEDGDGEEEEDDEDDDGPSQYPAYFTDLQQQVTDLSGRVDNMMTRQTTRWTEEDRQRLEYQQHWDRQFESLRNLFPPPPPPPQ